MQLSAYFPSPSRSLWLGLAVVLACSCNGEDTSVDTAIENLDPPELEFTGATTADGTELSVKDESAIVDCDPRVVFHLGPLDSTGQVKNWVLRPPGACEADVPCGYVRVALENAAGDTLVVSEAALPNVLVDLESVDLGAIRRVTARLIQASTLKPYLVDGKEVSARWDLGFEAPENCPDGQGGAGGDSGLGGAGGAAAL